MPNEKPLLTLYKGLKANNYDVPDDYDSFERTLTTGGDGGAKYAAQSRHDLYNALKSQNYDVPDSYEHFYSTLFEPVSKTASRAKGGATAQQHTQQSSGSGQQAQKAAAPKPQQQGMSAAERAAFINSTQGIVNRSQAGLNRTLNGINYAKQKMKHRNVTKVHLGLGGGTKRTGGNSNVMVKHKDGTITEDNGYSPELNQALGNTYVTEGGNEYDDPLGADFEQNAIDNQKTMIAQYNSERSVPGRLKSAYEMRDELEKKLEARRAELEKARNERGTAANILQDLGNIVASDKMGGVNPYSDEMRGYENDPEYMSLMSSLRKVNSSIQTLETIKSGKNNSFWRGLSDTLSNGYTFNDGLPEMRDATAIINAQKHLPAINKKLQSGQPLTHDEQVAYDVLRANVFDNDVQGQYQDQLGAWYRAGSTTGTSIDFMKDIAFTGGGAGSMTKGIYKGIVKKGTEALAKRGIEKGAKAAIAKGVLKATGIAAGTTAAGTMVSNTTGFGRVGAETGTNVAGQVGRDKDGNFTIEGQQSLLKGFANAERDMIGENQSEMFGEFIPGGGKFIKKGLEKIGLSKISGALTSIGNKEWYKQYSNLLKAGGWNGLPGEAMEEYEGMLFDALTGNGEQAWQQFKDPKTHIDIWLGCATTGALLGAVPTVVQAHHTAQYYRYKHATDSSDKVAAFRMTQAKWEPIKDIFDNTDNEHMADAVMDNVVNNKDLSQQEKVAALNYVRNLTKMRGYNIGTANNAGEEKDPEVEAQNEAYGNGYNTTDPTAMNDARNRLALAQQKLDEYFEGIGNRVDKEHGWSNDNHNRVDPNIILNDEGYEGSDGQHHSMYSDDVIQMAQDVVNAQQEYEGMLQRVRDDIDDEVQQTGAIYDSRTNDQGVIQGATLKAQNPDGTDRKVYITSGNVVMGDDGQTVDKQKSDMSIVVVDEDGKVEMISPDQIFSLDAPIDGAQAKQQAIDAIQQNKAQEAADKINGKVDYTAGNTYTLTDSTGQQIEATLVADEQTGAVENPDGSVNVSMNGKIVPMAKDTFQQMVDNTNMQRASQNDEGGQEQPTEQEGDQGILDQGGTVEPEGGNVVDLTQEGGGEEGGTVVPDEEEGTGAVPTYPGSVVAPDTSEPHDWQVDDTFTIDNGGMPVRGQVTGVGEDGVEIYTEAPVNGKKMQVVSPEDLQSMTSEINGQPLQTTEDASTLSQPTRPVDVAQAQEQTGNNGEENIPQNGNNGGENIPSGDENGGENEQNKPQRAIDRIPSQEVDDGKGGKKTVHNWEQAEPGDTYDALTEIYHGNADRVKKGIDNRVGKIDKAIKGVQKKMDAIDNSDDFDEVAAQAEQYDQLQQQKDALEQQKKYWQGVSMVPRNRQMEADRRTAEEKAAAKAAREKAEAEAAEKARQEREQVNGVPDVINDVPADARKRGFRNVNGMVVNRQGNTDGVTGRESNVKFSSTDTAKGHIKVIDADQLQPSHVSGQRNPSFFIDEAQPKDRTDTVSSMAAAKIASNLNPEEITGDGSAYQFSAPTVNSRGEVIQGNNRSDALKLMYSSTAFKPAQDAYKQYIADHAEEFGFSPEDIQKIQQMEHPVMVNELDVPDDEAIRLGQMKASDNESGGIERIDPVTTSQKLGGRVSNFASVLLSSPDEDASLSDVLMQNGAKAVKWLQSQGAISDTAAQSAFDKKGNLTPEARMDLQNILKQSLFQGGVSDLSAMFDKMPAKAQKAILSTFMRDYDSADSERILPEIQKAIEAWYGCAMANDAFAKASNYKSAKAAMHDWTLQTNMLDDNMPSDKFSNFAMELASRLQGCSMRETQQNLNDFFDLVQGKSQGDLFGGTTMGEQANRQESIRRIFNIEYKPISNNNGKTRSNAVADNNSQSEEGRQGSPADSQGRERTEGGEQPNADTGGTESHDEEGINNGDAAMQRPTQPDFKTGDKVSYHGGEYTVGKRNDDGSYELMSGPNVQAYSNVKAEDVKPTESTDTKQQPIGNTSAPEKVETERQGVNTEPTEKQKEAGNYKKGHIKVDGYDITIENPKGSTRSGKDADGKEWSIPMHYDYGYILGTKGTDGDHIDVYLSDTPTEGNVYVVDQIDQKTGKFDEHKVMYGFPSMEAARDAYKSQYEDGWKVGTITEVSRPDFKKWVESSTRKTKPFSEYKSMEAATVSQLTEPDGDSVIDEAQRRKSVVPDNEQKELNDKVAMFEKADNAFGKAVEKSGDYDDELKSKEENDTYQVYKKAKGELLDTLRKISPETLENIADGIEHADWYDKASVNTQELVRDVILENNRKRQLEDDYETRQEESKGIVPKEPQKKVSPADFLTKDKNEQRAFTQGIGHDGGNIIGTDGHVLYVQKAEYPKELEGKLTDKTGKVIEGKIPQWRKVIPKMEDTKPLDIDIDRLHRFTAGVNRNNRKGSYVAFKNSDGEINLYRSKDLDVFLRAAKQSGADVRTFPVYGLHEDAHPGLMFSNDKGTGMIMPADPSYINASYVYDSSTKAEEPIDVLAKETDRRNLIAERATLKADDLRKKDVPELKQLKQKELRQAGTDKSLIRLASGEKKDMLENSVKAHRANAELIRNILKEKNASNVQEQRVGIPSQTLSEDEIALRSAITGILRNAGIDVIDDDKEGQDILDEDPNANLKYHKVSSDEQKKLDSEPTVKFYRSMAMIDGKLYPPMSVRSGKGKSSPMREPTEIGVWERSDEDPTNVNEKGQFWLTKENGDKVPAAYNPYFHASNVVLNDQFSTAYKRPNLVVVEVEVPKSELTSGYRADKAAKSVGITPWHTGSVAKYLPEDNKRNVMLSRWMKVTRILPDSEVAEKYIAAFHGNKFEVPDNTVTPSLRAELEKRGVKIIHTNTVKKYEEAQRILELANAENSRHMRVYHGSGSDFDMFDTMNHLSEGEGSQAFGVGTYVADQRDLAEKYARNSNNRYQEYEGYVDGKPVNWNNSKTPASLFNAFDKLSKYGKEEALKSFEQDVKDYEFLAKHDPSNDSWERKKKESQESYDLINGNHLRIKDSENKHAAMLYKVDIPEDNGTNYLDWSGRPTDKLKEETYNKIVQRGSRLYKEGSKMRPASYYQDKLRSNIASWSNSELYDRMTTYLGSGKAVSEWLNSIGYTGIKVHAAYYSGDSRYNGNWNYVVFNDKDLKIADKIRLFRTKNGEAYGFTVGGKIYIDPRIATAETPLHEYTHLWADAIRAVNPKEWKHIVSLMKGTWAWDYVKQLYPELKTDDEIADEALAHFSGRRGAEKARKAMAEAEKKDGVFGKAAAISGLDSLRRALEKFWHNVCDLLHVHFTTAEEVADRAMTDMLRGFDPRTVGRTDSMKAQESEEAAIVAKAKEDGTYMKAPNGNDSNLSPKQWAQVRTTAFKDWFGDWEKDPDHASKVVDENGEPLVLYHHTGSNFYTFDRSKARATFDLDGFFFYPDNETGMEYGERSIPVFLNIKHPATNKDYHLDYSQNYTGRKERQRLQEEGYDGVINDYDDGFPPEYVAFEPNQIKSATNNIGTFSNDNPDIRYQLAGNGQDTATEDVEAVNEKFNEELQEQIDGTQEKGHVYEMGMPSDALLSTGIPDLPIRLQSSVINKKSIDSAHPYNLSEIKDLVRLIQHPVAIFSYGDKGKAQNLMIGISQDGKEGKQYLVGISLQPKVNGQVLEINSIRNVFPKNYHDWIHWINQGKLLRVDDKKEIQGIINALRINPVDYIDNDALNSAAKIVEDFENPVIKSENLSNDEPTTPAEAEESGVLYREVDDDEAARLDSEPTIKVYRAMQQHDGKLYPPMSGRVKTQVKTKKGTMRTKWVWRAPIELGKWEASEEHPEMADSKGQFKLDKGNGESVPAAYNPYIHTSRTPINDQFASAWNRPELVTVEVEVPASELTSGYHAEKAKDSVGETPWKSGPVGLEMAKQGHPRMVILSRWDKPIRIVPIDEVADEFAVRLAGTGISVPFNTVPPALREALVARGIEISEPQKGTAGEASRPSYEEWLKGNNREREGRGAYSDEDLSLINDPVAKWLGKSNRTKAQQKAFANRERKNMEAAVKRLAKRLHLDNVNIVMDASTLEGRKARAKGFYDRNTQQITIVIPNHSDVEDVMQTLLHEGVAHYGLRKLFGSHFDTFLDNVYAAADSNVRRRITDLAIRKYKGDFHVATEEYLASLAEDTDFERMPETFWQKIKRMFLAMLRDIGFEDFANTHAFTLSDNELRYILWRSYENLKEPGRYRSILGEAEDVAMQADLKVGNYAPESLDSSDSQAAEPNIKLSSIKNEFGKPFVLSSKGSIDMGIIDKASGLKEAPIRLSEGEDTVGNDGKHHGYGLLHIAAEHEKEIHNAGYNSIEEFVEDVASNYNTIREGNVVANNQTYLLELADKHNNTLYVELSRDGKYWNINSAGVFRKGYSKNKKEVYSRPAVGSSSGTRTAGVNHGDKNSATVTSGNSPLTSTAKIGNNSESGVNSSENVSEPKAWGKRDLLSKAEQISNGIEPDLLFRDTIEDNDNTARETYDKWANSAKEQFREAWQDSMINVRNLQEAVLKQRGEKLEPYEDAYNEENRSHGISKAKSEFFDDNFYKPLIAAVNAIAKKAKISLGDVTEYMMAKHGLERNEVFARRDADAAWTKYQEKQKAKFDEYQKAHPNGKLTQADFIKKSYDDFYNDYREKDYSGLTALTGTDNVQDAEAEARRIVADMEGRADTKNLWGKVNAATKWTLQQDHESGIISRDNYQSVKDMFKYYIPLRGWSEDTAGDIYDYVGSEKNNNAFSPTLAKAKGRKSQADNPIAYIGSMGISAIVQGEKNRVKQAFMRFAENHPSNLVTVSEMWYRNYGTETDPDWREDVPNIPENATADQVAAIVEQHEKDMKALEAQGLATKKRGKLHLGVPIKPKEATEHHVEVMLNGKKYVLYINGNPRAAQALNGTRARRASERSSESGVLARANRWLGQAYTSLNPAFTVSNLLRDYTMGTMLSFMKEGPDYARRFQGNMALLLGPGRMFGLMSRYKKGKLDMSKDMDKYFYEFMTSGAETGFTSLKDIEQYKDEMVKMSHQMNQGKANPKRIWRAFSEGVENTNRCIEDTVRFATYLTSRKRGRTVRDSVTDAKNITLNFNRKGSGEKGNATMRHLFIFVNPAIQALQTIASTIKHYPVRFAMGAGFISAMGMMQPLITGLLFQAFGGGDDDDGWNAMDEYWKLPTWQRRNNYVYWIPFTHKFGMIPLGQEFREFHGFGETLSSYIMGHKDPNPGLELANQVLGLLPLDFTGNSGNPVITLSPSILQPVVQVAFNTEFTGRPIFKDSEWNKYEPTFQKAYIGTPSFIVSASEMLNEKTGGNDHKQGVVERNMDKLPRIFQIDNPAILDHYLKGYLGGPYSFITGLGGMAFQAVHNHQAPDVQEIPVVNRLATAPRETEQGGKQKLPDWYYDLSEENSRQQNEFNGYKKDYMKGDAEGQAKFNQIVNSKDFQKWQKVNAYIGAVQQIRTAMNYTKDPDEKADLQKSLDEVLNELSKLR